MTPSETWRAPGVLTSRFVLVLVVVLVVVLESGHAE
jgi:hypothetical protein